MISPFTGGEVILVLQIEDIYFRDHLFTIRKELYECIDTGERFTTTEQDQKMVDDLIFQCEAKFGKLEPPFGEHE